MTTSGLSSAVEALPDPGASGARAAVMGAHLAARLLSTALRSARRAHPSRSELYEQRVRAATLHAVTSELLRRDGTPPGSRTPLARPNVLAAVEAEVALALDVAWAAADISDAARRLFATSILDVRPDAVTVCHLSHAAVASAAVIVADSLASTPMDPRVIEVSGCLSRARAAIDTVMTSYRYLEVELIS